MSKHSNYPKGRPFNALNLEDYKNGKRVRMVSWIRAPPKRLKIWREHSLFREIALPIGGGKSLRGLIYFAAGSESSRRAGGVNELVARGQEGPFEGAGRVVCRKYS